MQDFTIQEVSKHQWPSDCWTTIHGRVYDVSTFVAKHPGGTLLLMNAAGIDATALWESNHAPGKPARTLEKYCIGKLKGWDASMDQNFGSFFRGIQLAVYSWMETNNKQRLPLLPKVFACSQIVIFWYLYWFGIVKGSWMAVTVMAMLLPSMHGMVHAALHGGIWRSDWMMRIIMIMFFREHAMSGALYGSRLHQDHHCLTRDDTHDYEVQYLSPVFREDMKAPLRWWHAWQHKMYPFMPLLICCFGLPIGALFAAPGSIFLDHFAAHTSNLPFKRRSLLGVISMFPLMVFATVLGTDVGICFFWFSSHWVKGFQLMVVHRFVHSLMYLPQQGVAPFAYFFDAAHSILPSLSTEDIKTMDFGVAQMMTTHNIVQKWKLNFWLYGGPMQIEHHLLPAVSHVHFVDLKPIIQSVCKRYDIPYLSYNGMQDWYPHRLKHLAALGHVEN